MDGQLFNDVINFVKGVESFIFISYKIDILDVIFQVVNYLFCVGVVKNIIFL